jgi:hypothetical protein
MTTLVIGSGRLEQFSSASTWIWGVRRLPDRPGGVSGKLHAVSLIGLFI